MSPGGCTTSACSGGSVGCDIVVIVVVVVVVVVVVMPVLAAVAVVVAVVLVVVVVTIVIVLGAGVFSSGESCVRGFFVLLDSSFPVLCFLGMSPDRFVCDEVDRAINILMQSCSPHKIQRQLLEWVDNKMRSSFVRKCLVLFLVLLMAGYWTLHYRAHRQFKTLPAAPFRSNHTTSTLAPSPPSAGETQNTDLENPSLLVSLFGAKCLNTEQVWIDFVSRQTTFKGVQLLTDNYGAVCHRHDLNADGCCARFIDRFLAPAGLCHVDTS